MSRSASTAIDLEQAAGYRHRVKALYLATFLAACGTDAGTGGPDATDPMDGAAQFRDNCMSCHGDGSGTELAPSILNPSKGYATYVVRTGRNEMGFPNGGMAKLDAATVSDVELNAILDYLETASPKPTDGAGLYGRYCVNCHGADGRSGRVRKNIVGEAHELPGIIRNGHGGTSYGLRTSYMPKWTTAEISDAEAALIKSYLPTL